MCAEKFHYPSDETICLAGVMRKSEEANLPFLKPDGCLDFRKEPQPNMNFKYTIIHIVLRRDNEDNGTMKVKVHRVGIELD